MGTIGIPNFNLINRALGVFVTNTRHFLYYDSIRSGTQEKTISKLYKKVIEFLENKANQLLSDFSVIFAEASQQQDLSSCGVYMCYTAHRIAKNEPVMFSAEQALNYRLKMASNLTLK